jgi:hypothetical protein
MNVIDTCLPELLRGSRRCAGADRQWAALRRGASTRGGVKGIRF